MTSPPFGNQDGRQFNPGRAQPTYGQDSPHRQAPYQLPGYPPQ